MRKILLVDNVVALLVKADAYGLEDVRTATLGFLTRNSQPAPGQGPGKDTAAWVVQRVVRVANVVSR